MNISDEAVTAAAKVLYADKISNHAGDNAPQIIDACEKVARKVLEASAPFISAEAWHRGYVAALDHAAENLDTLWYERKDRMYQQRDWADGVEESEQLVKKMAAEKRPTSAD